MNSYDLPRPLVRIVDDEATVRNSELFIMRLAHLDAAAYESAEAFLEKDDLRRPGCIILDVRMPGMSGLELQQKLNERGAPLPILFLSGHGDINMAVMALKRGAEDFLEKPADPVLLQERVRDLIEKNVAERRRRKRIEMLQARWRTLTPREQDVMRLVAEGGLNKVIGAQLGIAEQTVKIHRANGSHKLGLHTAVDVNAFLKAIGEMPAGEEFCDV